MIDDARMRWYNTVVRNTDKNYRRDVLEYVNEITKKKALDELFGVK